MPKILFDQPDHRNEYFGNQVSDIAAGAIVRVIGKPADSDDELGAILLRVEADRFNGKTVSFVNLKDGSLWGFDLNGYKFVELDVTHIILD